MLFLQLTNKAIVVYPNSGEIWDGKAKRWLVSSTGFRTSLCRLSFSYTESTQTQNMMRDQLIWIVLNEQPAKSFDDDNFECFATSWRDAGAKLIGGCCRTTPSTVQVISKALKGNSC